MATSNDKKRYNYMENVLQNINKNYISLNDDEVKRNNRVLEEVLNSIIQKMKEKDQTFKKLYTRVFYGGSYYDGLRVGKPEEFDLDLLMSLPKYAEPTLTNSDKPGFLLLQLKEFEKWKKQPEAHLMPYLEKLLDNNHYVMTTKVSAWIEGIVRKALNEFPQDGNRTVFRTANGTFYAKIHKGGPAHTLKMEGTVNGKSVIMDVDLVPCFEFTSDKWPKSPYRSNPCQTKPNFFVVPKKPGGDGNVERYWRLSFQEQERVLIDGQRTLKPALKLLKKMRDTLDHKTIASYYLKTVFLWEVQKDKALWNESLSYVFMMMLKRYKEMLEKGTIPYFWNQSNNLVDKANAATRANIANKLKNIIDDIEKHPDDPFVVVKYLVPPNEYVKINPKAGQILAEKMQRITISLPRATQVNSTSTSRVLPVNSSSSSRSSRVMTVNSPLPTPAAVPVQASQSSNCSVM